MANNALIRKGRKEDAQIFGWVTGRGGGKKRGGGALIAAHAQGFDLRSTRQRGKGGGERGRL